VSISNYPDSADNPRISKFSESKEPPYPGIWKEKKKKNQLQRTAGSISLKHFKELVRFCERTGKKTQRFY
jgi:hypothetical protein